MMSARARSAAAALLLVAVEANVKDKFWGFLEDVSNEKRERSDVTTIAELLDQGAGVHVESCGGKSDVMTVSHADFIRASLQVRAYGSLSRNVSGGTLHVKMYKGSAAKGSSTEDWLKREMAWHSVPHAYEEDLCKHFSKSHSRRACPLPAGDTELRLALDKLPPMVVAGAYKLKIKATDEAGKSVACLRAQVDVPRGKSGELFRRVEALPTAPSGRTLSAHGQCMCGPSDPVCGDDGKTYAGACEAGCANVGVAYPGSCAGPARLGERELDRRTSAAVCTDTDDGATNYWGYDCAYLSPSQCSVTDHDDEDFTLMDMCCHCGGGTATAPTPAPATCSDTDGEATNSWHAGCDDLTSGWLSCVYHRTYYDDSDFTISDMCCVCGGGETATEYIWVAIVGDCTLDGDCVQSPNYPEDYDASQACTLDIDLRTAAPIVVESFATESYFDKLTVNGASYSGTSGPSGVTPSESIFWVSDLSVQQSGWRLCMPGASSEWWPPTPAPPTTTCVDDDAGVVTFAATNGATVTGCTDAITQGFCQYIGDYCCDCPGEATTTDMWVMGEETTTDQACEDSYSDCPSWTDYCEYDWYQENCAMSCGMCTASSCPATCYGRTCDEYAGWGYTCDTTESWGCDCSGCDCEVSTPAPTPKDEECVCTEEYDPVCVLYDYYNYQNTCYAECDGGWNLDDLEYGTDYVYGTCDEECVCTEEYDPVCLYDYYNYQNTCYAECDGFYVNYIDSDDWYYGTCSDVSGVASRGLALLFSLSLAALPQ